MSPALSLRRNRDDPRQSAHVRDFAAAQKLVEDSGMSSLRRSPEKIRVPKGFSFSAVKAGIKVSGRPDLALVEVWGRAPSPVQGERSSAPAASAAAAAALFTTNRVAAAPVEIGR